MKQHSFKNIDNAPLIVFRIFFGFLIACESFGAIFTGWVKQVFIAPQFTFSFIAKDRKSYFLLNPTTFFCIFREENIHLQSFKLIVEY